MSLCVVVFPTLRHCRYRGLLYGTVGVEGYFTALSVSKTTLRYFRYRRLFYGTVGTEGYFTALSVSKATLRHCRHQKLFGVDHEYVPHWKSLFSLRWNLLLFV